MRYLAPVMRSMAASASRRGAPPRRDEVAAIYTVAGRYDLIAQVGAGNWEEFGEKILNRIRPIQGIRATETALYF